MAQKANADAFLEAAKAYGSLRDRWISDKKWVRVIRDKKYMDPKKSKTALLIRGINAKWTSVNNIHAIPDTKFAIASNQRMIKTKKASEESTNVTFYYFMSNKEEETVNVPTEQSEYQGYWDEYFGEKGNRSLKRSLPKKQEVTTPQNNESPKKRSKIISPNDTVSPNDTNCDSPLPPSTPIQPTRIQFVPSPDATDISTKFRPTKDWLIK